MVGPLYDTDPSVADQTDFISLELREGYPRLRLNLGDEQATLDVRGRNAAGEERIRPLSDGRWHTIEVIKNNRVTYHIVFKKIETSVLFCEVTDTPVLDFGWRLLWVSKRRQIPQLRALTVKKKWPSKGMVLVTNNDGNKTPDTLVKETLKAFEKFLCRFSERSSDRRPLRGVWRDGGHQHVVRGPERVRGGRGGARGAVHPQCGHPAPAGRPREAGQLPSRTHPVRIQRLHPQPQAQRTSKTATVFTAHKRKPLVQIISLLICQIFIYDLFAFRSMTCISAMLENSRRLERKTGAHVPRMRAQTVPSTARVTAIWSRRPRARVCPVCVVQTAT